MPKVKDMLGNERNVIDEAITISIERYNELIIIEAEYNKKNKCVSKESEEK